jgi:hypothetical protein
MDDEGGGRNADGRKEVVLLLSQPKANSHGKESIHRSSSWMEEFPAHAILIWWLNAS